MNLIFPLKTYLHIFQLEGYSPVLFMKWCLTHTFTRTSGTKKPLVWTHKAITLYYLALFLTFLPFFILGVNFTSLLIFTVLILFPTTQLLFALFLIKPYEIYNKGKTVNETREKIRKLKNKGLIVIGITGSFGKTSVKEFLYQILKSKHKVLRTPKSYNTVFGIAKVVDLELDDTYKFFLCEMGAYKRGEIKELCNMVYPDNGILTGIAEQHLDLFGSLDNIIKGKFELLQALPKDGIAVLNGDNQYIFANKDQVKTKKVLYGIGNPDFDIHASNIGLTTEGTEFTLHLGNRTKKVKTSLIGKSNLQNILGAALLSWELGMNIEEITEAIYQLEPIPNRLELMRQNDFIVINDAYNSNTEGFREAIETVALFKTHKKIIVTPGIIDFTGQRNEEVHAELGKKAAGVFDYAILVTDSGRTRGLKKGLLAGGFSEENIYIAQSLDVARKKLAEVADAKSIVLFENDLPDNY